MGPDEADGRERLLRRLEREHKARLEAEAIAEKALRNLYEANRALRRSNAELEQFAYVASHDLQEPLRMVASYCELLARRYEGQLDGEAEKYIGYAVGGARHLQQLVNDLLAFSRIGTQGRPFTEVDCEAVLAQVLDGLALAIGESGGTVTHDPLPTVGGDPAQLGELLQNLIANGLKFRGAEPPAVHVRAERRATEWLFSVRDNGIGIDPRYNKKIFKMFQRLHRREQYPGTGIGLAVCQRIVERHGGRVWVESEPGKGATFCFTVPAERRGAGAA